MRFAIFILKPNALVLDPLYGKEIKQNELGFLQLWSIKFDLIFNQKVKFYRP